MQGAKGLSPDQIRAFLKASEDVHFQGRNREEVCQWVSETLRLQGYRRLGRTARGLVRRYVEKMTGLSRAQIARRITQYLQSGEANHRSGSAARAGSDARAVPVPDSGVSFRQRQRVRQSHRSRVVEQAFDRADQIAAEVIGAFYREHFNPYLNFHRPCGVPEREVNAKGKEKKRYRWYAAPWEILRQLPGVAGYLKPEVTIQDLDGFAKRQTGTQAALAMQQAKRQLFARFRRQQSA